MSEEREKRGRRNRYFVFISILGIICILFILGAWGIFYSSLFSVQNINISGNDRLSREEIIAFLKSRILEGAFWKRVLGFQNILVWPRELKEENLKFLPQLRSIKIEKRFRERSINVRVEERKPFGIWCLRGTQINAENEPQLNAAEEADKWGFGIGANQRITQGKAASCWWFDEQGILYEKTLAVEGNIIPAVNDYSRDKLGLGAAVLPADFMSNLLSIFRALRGSEVSIKEVRLEDLGLEEIKIETNAGPELYFSLRFPADNTLAVLESFKDKNGLKNIQYIDFRVENRAYYK